MKCGSSSTHCAIIIDNSKLKLIGKTIEWIAFISCYFSYKKKVREYQTDFEQQKSINELKKAKEEEAMQKINLIEGELLMSNKKPDLTSRQRFKMSWVLTQWTDTVVSYAYSLAIVFFDIFDRE